MDIVGCIRGRLGIVAWLGLWMSLPACGGDGGVANATSSSSSSGGAVNVEPGDVAGCDATTKLYENPADPAQAGPFAVGVKTAAIDNLTVEIWYPAPWGSSEGKEPVTYDLRQWLPAPEQTKIPDADNPWQVSKSFRDLALDDKHGPYPVVIFLHGTAGFRTQSLSQMEHWASRGFVVLAADYPGLYLGDALEFKFTSDLPVDTQKIVDALDVPAGDLSFLAGHIDKNHLGMVGHSAGGNGIQSFGDVARVLIPLAAGGADPGMSLESTLIMGGMIDAVVNYDNQVSGYNMSPPKKRLIGLSKGSHLFPTELCWLVNSNGKNLVEVAQQYMIKNANLANGLFDCPDNMIAQDAARTVVNYATAAALEESLQCKQGDMFKNIEAKFPEVGEYKEAL